jgi:formate dehydrogenase maturation protein FdhE
MKKWLIRCLTVLAMVCLIPGIVLKAAAETTTVRCKNCESVETREVLGYRIYDSNSHRVYVAECKNCHNDGNVSYLKVHTGGTETPTCTTGKTCEKCGAEYGEKDPNNHDLVHHDAKAPSCTEIGWDAYDTCSRCDYTTRKELPALNHDLRQSVITAPTCTETGWAYVKCSRCDYYDTPVLPALKHDLRQRVITAPTCTGEGWAHVACSRCDYFTSLVLSALNHDLEQHAAQAPTCMEKGWNAYETCSRCDYTTYVELPAQHDFVHHQAKAPTCTEIGWDAYETCSRCDYTTRKELPALNHDLVQHAAKAPTCTEIGWNAYEACSRFGCDYTTRKELPALNHDLEQHDAKAPTCTEIGWNAYETCSRCDHTTYTELPALNHDYQAVTVAPTCETDGYTVFTCSRCKDSYTADPTDQLGHKFGAWSPNGTGSQSADCLRDGCAHTGSTDCRKFTFRTAEGETLTFCPVCGQAENAAQLEMIEAATAWANSGSLSAEDVTARTNGEYLSVAFETAGSLTQPTGRVRLALPAGLLEGKKLVRIAPDGTQTEMPFETERGKLIYTLDFANSELPVMLFRLVPQTTAL